jgi:uncharacterized protein
MRRQKKGLTTMNNFRRTFPKAHTFLPVIHVVNEEQALANAQIAKEAGADGVFLINHQVGYQALLQCYERVVAELPGLWVGLNCLDLGRAAIGIIPRATAGLWTDSAGIEETGGDHTFFEARRFLRDCADVLWEGVYFGGVAFKYQTPVSDFAAVAKAAVPWVDVITTSGTGTGVAPDVRKIATMKAAIGEHPLAIASGITAENVRSFMPYADCFLVATGISKSHIELDPAKVCLLANQLNH